MWDTHIRISSGMCPGSQPCAGLSRLLSAYGTDLDAKSCAKTSTEKRMACFLAPHLTPTSSTYLEVSRNVASRFLPLTLHPIGVVGMASGPFSRSAIRPDHHLRRTWNLFSVSRTALDGRNRSVVALYRRLPLSDVSYRMYGLSLNVSNSSLTNVSAS